MADREIGMKKEVWGECGYLLLLLLLLLLWWMLCMRLGEERGCDCAIVDASVDMRLCQSRPEAEGAGAE